MPHAPDGAAPMPLVEVYTQQLCPYCWRAKRLLDARGVAYREVDVGGDAALRRAMAERAGGRRTVPQIFIDGRAIGGSDDLHELDRSGELKRLLGPDAGTSA